MTCLLLAVVHLLASPRAPRFLAHFYYVNDPSSFDSLQANFTHIGLVSPQWFSADRAGNLTSTVESPVVDWAQAQRLTLMPLLANEKFDPQIAHAVLTDECLQSHIVDQILQAAVTHGFYGLQLDFENISPGDRGAYTQFVAKLSRALRHRRFKLSVAVPAPLAPAPVPAAAAPDAFSWSTNQHSLAFDYEALGKLADFITLMAYDEYASPKEPGPIAGFPWVEACLRQTLEAVPRKKLFLGIPLYYRHWSKNSIAEGPCEEALNLAKHWGVKVEIDPEQKEQTFKFEEGETAHVVWLHGAPSLVAGMSLVEKYRLAGFSAWRLGQEDPAAWQGVFPSVRKKLR